jgi:phosphoserine phosphatase RsbU/P
MATLETVHLQTTREQLQSRRQRLETVLEEHPTEQLNQLLTQVDEALERIDNGQFGLCTVCHDTVEADRLLRDPMISVCLGCLSPSQQRALEFDLELAARIQNGLLPAPDLAIPGWQVAYHYRPAGVIGGDYFDVIGDGKGGAYFLIADVAGKGVAAAMLTANLRAVFRALLPMELGVEETLLRANRLFCEGKLSTQYATLVFGYSSAAGKVQLVNAGHLPALLVRGSEITRLESSCMPLGIFADQEFAPTSFNLRPGDMLVLYTDGVSEAQEPAGEEYGVCKLEAAIREKSGECPEILVKNCRDRLQEYRNGTERADDETLLAIQYMGAAASASA